MLHRRRIVTAFLAVAIFAPAVSARSITTIDVPGAVTTAPQGINSPGEVVGLTTGADGVTHGSALLAHGQMVLRVPGVEHRRMG